MIKTSDPCNTRKVIENKICEIKRAWIRVLDDKLYYLKEYNLKRTLSED